MLEPSSSEDENENVNITQVVINDTCNNVNGNNINVNGTPFRSNDGRQTMALVGNNQAASSTALLSNAPMSNANQYYSSSTSLATTNQIAQQNQRINNINNDNLPNNAQQAIYLSDRLLPVRASLAHARATSPNPPERIVDTTMAGNIKDIDSLDEEERAEREEAERKIRLQLYVFVLRCVAYPFNAKQPDLNNRELKITLQQSEQIINRFQSFLNGELNIPSDDAFNKAIQNYFDAFLKSNRLHMLVVSGACCSHDFREVFRRNIEKRVRSLPETEGMTKELVVSQWLTKFDAIFRSIESESENKKLNLTAKGNRLLNRGSELILSKEQLYDMFQNILKIKKFEHQLLYNTLQVIFSEINLEMLICK